MAQEVARKQARQHKAEDVAQKGRMWHKRGGGRTKAEEVEEKGRTVHKSGGGGTKVEEVAHMWCMTHKTGGRRSMGREVEREEVAQTRRWAWWHRR